MADDTLIPITEEQAKLGQELVKAFSGLGSFLADALGSTPKDLIGYLGGDWLRFRRIENIAKMMERTRERLAEAGVTETEPASLTVALPILRGAADESREELQDLWARLMAAALDPSKAGSVRQGFAEVVAKMDPIDALVMGYMKSQYITGDNDDNRSVISVALRLDISEDQLEASLWNLERLALVKQYESSTHATAFGREFMKAVSD